MTTTQRIIFAIAILLAALGFFADAVGFFELIDVAWMQERSVRIGGPYCWSAYPPFSI